MLLKNKYNLLKMILKLDKKECLVVLEINKCKVHILYKEQILHKNNKCIKLDKV